MTQKIAIGRDNFKILRDENSYYIDKSLMIKEIIDSQDLVTLLTRPRRFGKTLNMSMLKYFFEHPKCRENECENPSQNAKYLFEDLAIWKEGEKYQNKLGKYPVIYLTLKNAKGGTWEKTYQELIHCISAEYQRHQYLLQSSFFEGEDKTKEREDFQKIIEKKAIETEYTSILINLSHYLNRYFGEKTIIIIDEYDTPIQAGYLNGYFKDVIEFMKAMLVKGFKDNPYLKKGILTGIMKVAKESIFSDFNNSVVYTVLTDRFKTSFGFTQEEVFQIGKDFHLEDQIPEIQKWYDGYVFGKETHIYNPWSILNYVNNPQDGFKCYWVNTSSNEMVKDILQLDKAESKKSLEKLLAGETIRKSLKEHVVYQEITTSPEAAWSFLVHAGYLKVVKKYQEGRHIEYDLSIPNLEVEEIYEKMLQNYFEHDIKISNNILDIQRALFSQDTSLFESLIQNMYDAHISYYDTKVITSYEDTSENIRRHENFHHGFILGLLMFTSEYYEIYSNREFGGGRPDIVLLPKDRTKPAYVFELKWDASKGSKTISQLLTLAKNQIKEKKYVEGIQNITQIKEVIPIIIAFKGKNIKTQINPFKKGKSKT